jgi:peptidoglycan/LPS O-acetylase OafA/YrhL
LFRLVFWFGVHPLDYRLEWFRYNPLLRIDACAFGVMLACVLRGRAAWRPSPRARLMLFGGFVAAAAAGVVFLRALPMVGELEHKMALRVMLAFYHVAYWPALDLAALGAMLALLGVWPGRRGVLAAVIRFFSRTSYGLYLIHLPVFAIVPVYTSGLVPEGAATLALVLGVTLLLASLGYRLIEAPILAWRDRRLPVGGAARAARAASVVPAAVVEASVP